LITVFVSTSIGADMNGPAISERPSSSVGDYLKAIWELAGEGTASTKDVAERLSISSASVTNMFVRLREMELTEYERYQGASLTDAGRMEALRLLRRHRLIEAFLLEHLGYAWDEVHEEAESLEHAVSDEFTERLAKLLGYPEHDPHGDPIPGADGSLEPDDSFPLSKATTGQRVRIYRVGDEEAGRLAYLEEHGLMPGRLLKVKEARALDGVITVEDEGGEAHSIGGPLASSIFVRNIPEDGG
jgi:DtxR family Mn-dependent transcriptional regulator